MLKKINVVWYVIVLLGFCSCSKDNDEEDKTAGTISCLIDGTAFTSTNTDIQMYPSNLVISAFSGTSVLSMYISDASLGNYSLNSSTGNDASFTLLSGGYSTSNVKDVDAFISIREINTIDSTISGTFTFEATSVLTNKKIKVTDGKINKVKFVKKAALPNSMSCKVNGTAVSVANLSGSLDFNSLYIGGSSLFFAQKVGITMNPNISPGTYDLEFNTDNYGYFFDDTAQLFGYYSKSGKLVIKSHNKTAKTISGTFEFIGEEKSGSSIFTKSITDGKFNVTYE